MSISEKEGRVLHQERACRILTLLAKLGSQPDFKSAVFLSYSGLRHCCFLVYIRNTVTSSLAVDQPSGFTVVLHSSAMNYCPLFHYSGPTKPHSLVIDWFLPFSEFWYFPELCILSTQQIKLSTISCVCTPLLLFARLVDFRL